MQDWISTRGPFSMTRASDTGRRGVARTMRTTTTLLVLVTLIAAGQVAPMSAQSLGTVARQEQERRKAVSKAGKVYTNDTLRPDSSAPPSASAVPAEPDSTVPTTTIPLPAEPQASAKPGAEAAPALDEKGWRARVTAAREQVRRNELFAESLQSRINALTTDFVNRDDPAQRSLIDQDRQRSLAELERVKNEIAEGQKAIAAIEEEARRANVPPGWLRPA